MEFSIAGVFIMPLVLGLVEFLKKFGVDGEYSTLAAALLGMFFGGLLYAMEQNLIPAVALPWIGVVVFGLAFGMSASGFYALGKRFLS